MDFDGFNPNAIAEWMPIAFKMATIVFLHVQKKETKSKCVCVIKSNSIFMFIALDLHFE